MRLLRFPRRTLDRNVNSAQLVRARDLGKVYRSEGVPVCAISHLDLDIAKGEFIAVMGPSGSGKSTLLHLLAGLVRPTMGELWLAGRRVDHLSEAAWSLLRRTHVGVVFQFFNLIANMSVADNVELPALLTGMRPRDARARREDLLERLGLTDKAGAPPARLSGGEQQRVAIARALANRPSVLLADEPTGNLDSTNSRGVLRLLSRIHGEGQTIVLVTHDAKVASMADRIISLHDGMIVDDAPMTAGKGASVSAADIIKLQV